VIYFAINYNPKYRTIIIPDVFLKQETDVFYQLLGSRPTETSYISSTTSKTIYVWHDVNIHCT